MFERISWIAEIVNVVLCLHFLYGQKIKSKAATGILIVADWFVMEVITQYSLSQINIVVVYIIIWAYTIVEFGKQLKQSVVADMLVIILMSLFQLLASIPWVLFGESDMGDISVLLLQLEVLVISGLLRRKMNLLFRFLVKKNYVALILISSFAIYIISQIVYYRILNEIPAEYFIPVIIFGTGISVFAYYWQKEREKREEKELELKISQLCESSFRELIDTIRMKQHDFYNHIHTLQCLHYTAGNYEELVREQERYCADIKYDNRYYSLLTMKSPVISGFLYGKFMEADRQGIGIEYDVSLKRLVASVPEYVIIEMTGILWDNAVQYVKVREKRKIKISLREYVHEPELRMEIAVENPVVGLSNNEIPLMFQESYSTKKDHTGIGLSKIRYYTEKYPVRLKAEKIKYDQEEWLRIALEISEPLGEV